MGNLRIITILLVFSLCTQFLNAQTTVQIDKVPTSIEEFVKLRNEKATTPEGGVAMFCIAMKVYQKNEELGEKCFVAIADRSELREGNTYKGYTISSWYTIKLSRTRYPLIANSYIVGATPKNGYTAKLPYKYKFTSNPHTPDPATGKAKIFIVCNGSDSPRPIHMVKNNRGIWKAKLWSSLFAGMKPAIQEVDDDI